jgi:hypothetical protein
VTLTLKINRVPVFQILLRSKYVPSLVKIHWRMLILVFTRMLRSKNLTRWLWPMTLKINRVPDSPKDYVCTKFGQNPLKDLDSRVFTRMLCGKHLTLWLWLTKLGTYLILTRVWNPIDFQGQSHRVKFLPHDILVNTLESRSFNGFW